MDIHAGIGEVGLGAGVGFILSEKCLFIEMSWRKFGYYADVV